MRLPREARRFFGLRSIRAMHVGLSEVEGRRVRGEAYVRPRLRALPMGWTWALYFCQAVHEACVLEAGLGEDTRIYDGKPTVSLDREPHLQYVDNFAVIGTNRDRVAAKLKAVRDVLLGRGLALHKEEVSDGDAELLGWRLCGSEASLRPTARRLWRLRLGIRSVLRRGTATGEDIQRLVGHAVFVGLCRRERERAWRSSPVATGSPRGSRSAPRRLCGAALRRSWTSGSAHSSGPTYRRDGRQTLSPSTPPRGAWVPSAPRPTAPRCASAAGKTSGGVSACRRPLAPHAAVPSGHSSTRWTRGHSRPPRALAERAARISTDCSARSTT